MNKVTLWKTSTLVLAGALAFVIGNDIHRAEADPQPQMKSALASLREASNHLEKASSDKGGHRVAAKKLTEQAIEEVKKGIEYDNKKSSDGVGPDEEVPVE